MISLALLVHSIVLHIILQLLAEDPSLKPFKSYKKSVLHLKRIGDVLTVAVVAGIDFYP